MMPFGGDGRTSGHSDDDGGEMSERIRPAVADEVGGSDIGDWLSKFVEITFRIWKE